MKNSPVPQSAQKCRRPCSEDAYTLCTFVTLTRSMGYMVQATMGAAGVPPAVRAMAKRMGEDFAIRLVANSATVAAAGDRHARFSLPSAIALGHAP